ncbi:hypothetical protein [Pseudomonas folii]|uniref:Type VI secretion protein n=1 Tax=Pseudomonas folii TaxID=2762593 RepID=A0ABR7AUS4_9PSED|nr:hypothetical protein [Pseudomonas folii]MBC3948669.1 hypothetical protein [Pseudomonas folii]
MPVNIRALPEKLSLPLPPRNKRWCLVVLLCSMIVAGLVFFLWPDSRWRMTPWFWCCVLVLPLMGGVTLYALRLLAFERRTEFVESWNQNRTELEQALIEHGQRPIALLGTSYCSGAGNNLLAQVLRNGSKPLYPTFLKSQGRAVRLSQLSPPAQLHDKAEYTQRLSAYFDQVMKGLEPELQLYASDTPLRVRIRHNQVLCDDEVLALWRSSIGERHAVDQVVFANQDDGLLWIDALLDEPAASGLLLSLEVNLFLDPIAEQAESVSTVLLAAPDWCARKGFAPSALIHRPVQISDQADALKDALLWGQIQKGATQYFAWYLQMPSDFLCDTTIALNAEGYPPDIEARLTLDDSFGRPGCAVGNIALIVASEGAKADRRAQMIMLQDASPQVCVVQPA